MRCYRRSRKVPSCWRLVDDSGGPAVSYERFRQWELVLTAARINHMVVTGGRYQQIYVPPLLEVRARQELAAFRQEQERSIPPLPELPAYRSGYGAVWFFLLLLGWHGLMAGWFTGGSRMPLLEHYGALDVQALRAGEWYRGMTALTLHSGTTHILANVAFGTLFLTLLGRKTGLGVALFLTLLGGGLGNVLQALFRAVPFVSMGFSTAVFASLGALAGVRGMPVRGRGEAFLSLAAALALLAMLGTAGEHVDYGAHLGGLAAGYGLGLAAHGVWGWRRIPERTQGILGALAMIGLGVCWALALP